MAINDPSAHLLPGPWEHRFVGANGARFHVAVAGEGPLVLLLHGFPQSWWAWRHQLPALAQAGHRVAAMDLRGYGASDKPPHGYETWSLARDVASVIRSLGATEVVVVGHGLGAWLAWCLPHLDGSQVRALATIGVPHPAAVRHRLPWKLSGFSALPPVSSLLSSRLQERRLVRDPDYVGDLLRNLASPHSGWPDEDSRARYAEAMAMPFSAHAAGEAHRWILKSALRPEGFALLRRITRPVQVPVLALHGADDPLCRTSIAQRSRLFVEAPFELHILPGAGHFPHEETPGAVTDALLGWLVSLP